MKKIIAILLSLSIFGSIGMAFDSQSFNELGVSISDDETKLALRKEFISNVINYLAMPLVEDNEQIFNDVPPSLDMYDEINTAYLAGILKGNDTLTFNPDTPVTYGDAVKILVDLLGYDAYVKLGKSYAAVAAGIGLTDGISYSDNQWMTHKDMGCLFSNLLMIPCLEIKFDGVNYTYVEDGKTLIEKYRHSSVREGLVQSVGNTTIQNNLRTIDGYVIIGGETYDANGIDMMPYVGKLVQFIYKEDDWTLEAVSAAKKCVSVELELRDVVSYANMTVWYRADGGKEKRIRFDANTFISYNGVPVVAFNPQLMIGENGSIKFIDNNSDNIYDVIIIEEYEDYFVGNIDSENKIIYDKYKTDSFNNIVSLDLSGVNEEDFVNEAGQPVEFTEIKRDSLVCVKKTDSGSIVKVVVCYEIKSGQVTHFNHNDRYITVGGKKLYVTQECINRFNIKAGDFYTLYINPSGNVAVIKIENGAGVKYGYIRGLNYNSDDETMYVKLLTQDNEHIRCKVNKKFLLDGVRREHRYQEVLNTFSDINGFLPQMVRYTLDNSGNISMLDSAGPMNEGGSPSLVNAFPKTASMKYRKSARSFASKLLIDDYTPVFKVPDESDPTKRGTYEDRNYTVTTYNGLADERSYTVSAYATDNEAYDLDAFIVYEVSGTSGSMYESTYFSVIKALGKALNEDGEAVTVIDYYYAGDLLRKQVVNENVITDNLPSGVELKVGDIVRFEVNSDNKISYIHYIHSVDGAALDDSIANFSSGEANSALGTDTYRVYSLGHVYKCNNSKIYFAKKADILANASLGLEDRVAYRYGSTSIVIYDPNETEKVRLGTLSELIETSGNTPGDLVFIKVYLGTLQSIYVIRG